MKTKALIFLNGMYPEKHRGFYISEYLDNAVNSIVIAVDGGLRFLLENDLKPDIIIGDLDSIDQDSLDAVPQAKVVTTPIEGKNLTDGELALDWCAGNNIAAATIYGGIDASFETDHLLGNIFMMFAFKDRFTSIKMRDFCQEIIPLENESLLGEGKPGDMLSIAPVSNEIIYQAQGLKYDPAGRVFKFGQTMPLRNELAESRFKISIKGRAVVVRHYNTEQPHRGK